MKSVAKNNTLRNIKLLIEYEGTHYHGWQTQANDRTIQETIIKAIKRITAEKVTLYGAGRTDASVHAIGQVANFSTHSRLAPERIMHALNAYLPGDIVAKRADDVPLSFNAQRGVKAKTYTYTIINSKTPSALQRNFSYLIRGQALDINRMRKAARHLVGKHDFRAFTTHSNLKQNCVRTIYLVAISRHKDLIQIKVKGNGFLYKMVRVIVGTLVLVGQGKIKPVEVKKILDSRDRGRAGPTAPGRGLCLVELEY